jgi:hypothetical protein
MTIETTTNFAIVLKRIFMHPSSGLPGADGKLSCQVRLGTRDAHMDSLDLALGADRIESAHSGCRPTMP